MRRKRTGMTKEERRAAVLETAGLILDAMENGTGHHVVLELEADREPEHAGIMYRSKENGFDMKKGYDCLELFDLENSERCARMLADARRLLGTQEKSPAAGQGKTGQNKNKLKCIIARKAEKSK